MQIFNNDDGPLIVLSADSQVWLQDPAVPWRLRYPMVASDRVTWLVAEGEGTTDEARIADARRKATALQADQGNQPQWG